MSTLRPLRLHRLEAEVDYDAIAATSANYARAVGAMFGAHNVPNGATLLADDLGRTGALLAEAWARAGKVRDGHYPAKKTRQKRKK